MGGYISAGGFGIRRLVDAFQTYAGANNPVYLRIRNFPSVTNQLWAQLGFSIAPSGTSNVGTTDVLITPRPSVQMVSVHNIGQSQGKLRFGARTFAISHSFVLNMKLQLDIQTQTDDYIWRGQQTVGLVTDNQLFSIEDIAHEEWQGSTITWTLTANAAETG